MKPMIKQVASIVLAATMIFPSPTLIYGAEKEEIVVSTVESAVSASEDIEKEESKAAEVEDTYDSEETNPKDSVSHNASPISEISPSSVLEEAEETPEQKDAADGDRMLEYICSHLATEYVGVGENPKVEDMMTVFQTYADGTKFADQTLDGLWEHDSHPEHDAAFISQNESIIPLYSVSDEGEYYVGYADTADSDADITEALAGRNDTSGSLYDDVVFDETTGLVYVPKRYTGYEDGKRVLNSVRLQLLYCANGEDADTAFAVNIESTNIKGDVASAGTATASVSDYETKILLAEDDLAKSKVTEQSIDAVEINGIKLDRDGYEYDEASGVLSVDVAPSTIEHMDVEMSNGILKSIKGVVDGLFGSIDAEAASWNSYFVNTTNTAWTLASAPKAGDEFVFSAPTYYHNQTRGTGGIKGAANKTIAGNYAEELVKRYGLGGTGDILIVGITGWSNTDKIEQNTAFYRTAEVKGSHFVNGSTLVFDNHLDTICAHIGVAADGTIDGSSNVNVGDNVRYNQNVRVKIVEVDNTNHRVKFVVILPTLNTQAGVGIYAAYFKSPTKTFAPKMNIQKVDQDGNKIAASFQYQIRFKTANTGWSPWSSTQTSDSRGRSSVGISATGLGSIGGAYTDWGQYVAKEKNIQYQIKETKAPEGYEIAQTTFSGTVNLANCAIGSDGSTYTVKGGANWQGNLTWTNPNVTGVYAIKNNKITKTSLSIRKYNGITDKSMAGVSFSLHKMKDPSDLSKGWTDVGELTTNANGIATYNDAEIGARYVAIELVAKNKTVLENAGVQRSSSWWFSTIMSSDSDWNTRWREGTGSNGQSLNISGEVDRYTRVYNYAAPTYLIINKVDSEGTPIEGVLFKIYELDTHKEVASIRTNADGRAETGKILERGKFYYAVEQVNDAQTKAALDAAGVKGDETWYFSTGLSAVNSAEQWNNRWRKGEKNTDASANADPYTVDRRTDNVITEIVNEKLNQKTLQIRKLSDNTGCTTGNTNYSLEGAVFGIYSDSDLKNEITTVTTNERGIASYSFKDTSSTAVEHTFYVKELKAPKGYLLNDETFTVTFEADAEDGATKTITVADPPGADPNSLSIQKEADISDITLPSLEGAEFTVKFYTDIITSGNPDPASQGLAVAQINGEEAVWVLRTDENGHIKIDDNHKVSGPEFIKDEFGGVVWPIGTMSIQETIAPSGYLVNSDIIVTQFTEARNSADTESLINPTHKKVTSNGAIEDITVNEIIDNAVIIKEEVVIVKISNSNFPHQ